MQLKKSFVSGSTLNLKSTYPFISVMAYLRGRMALAVLPTLSFGFSYCFHWGFSSQSGTSFPLPAFVVFWQPLLQLKTKFTFCIYMDNSAPIIYQTSVCILSFGWSCKHNPWSFTISKPDSKDTWFSVWPLSDKR